MSALHEYVALKKSVLQLDDIHMYDLYAPLAKEEPPTFRLPKDSAMSKKHSARSVKRILPIWSMV